MKCNVYFNIFDFRHVKKTNVQNFFKIEFGRFWLLSFDFWLLTFCCDTIRVIGTFSKTSRNLSVHFSDKNWLRLKSTSTLWNLLKCNFLMQVYKTQNIKWANEQIEIHQNHIYSSNIFWNLLQKWNGSNFFRERITSK